MALRVVLDTNVLVAALLTPGRTPERALDALWARGATVLLDARIEAEYRSVLARAKFAAVPDERRDALLASVLARGRYVPDERLALARGADALLDDDDRAFVEVARAGEATWLVTGNVKHFPPSLALPICTPAALLAALCDEGAAAAQAPTSSERTKAS